MSTKNEQSEKLSSAQAMIRNALTGLSMRGEDDSPLVRDLKEADTEMEKVRQWLLAD